MALDSKARRSGLWLIGLLLASLLGCGGLGPVPPAPKNATAQTVESRVLAVVNRHRASVGLRKLKPRADLSEIARQHSYAMAVGRRGYGHRGFDSRKREVAQLVPWTAFAENLTRHTRAPADKVPSKALRAWLGSPGHRSKIEASRYQLTGIGAAVSPEGTWYVTQLFVKPQG